MNFSCQRSDADMAITSQGDLNELFDVSSVQIGERLSNTYALQGEEWPLSMASFLDIHSPRIDVTRGDRKGKYDSAYISARLLKFISKLDSCQFLTQLFEETLPTLRSLFTKL